MTAFLFSFCTAETDQLHLLCQACAVCLAQVMWLFLKWNVSRTGGPVVRGTSRALRHAGELGACALITHSFPGRPEVPEQGALCSFAFVQLMCSPSRRSRKYVLVPPEVLIQHLSEMGRLDRRGLWSSPVRHNNSRAHEFTTRRSQSILDFSAQLDFVGTDPVTFEGELEKDCRQRKLFECLLAVYKHNARKASQFTRGVFHHSSSQAAGGV